jgi:predicted phage tail protein
MNQRQTGKIIDLLSEGPIEGIVGDDAGIFLNGTPVIDSEERETLGYVPGEISFVSGVTYDFTPDSGFDLTEIDLAIGDRNIVVWDAINEGSTDAYIKEKKHPYVLRTPNVTWTDADIGSLIILGDGQNGATETFRVASIHIYSGANSFIKIDRASQGPYGASNTRQLWRAQIRQVQSIVNSTRITVDSAFTESLTNRKATILSINSTSLDTSVSTKNFDSVKTIFRSGRQDQPILDPVFGGGQTAFATNLNEEILQTTRSGPYSISGQDDKVYTATTTMGISSPENIDKVKINIRFPSLIAYSKIGSEYSQGIEFQIFLEYKRNGVWYNHTGTLANFPSNQPVLGISDDDIQNRNPVNIDSSSDTEKRVTKYALATSLSTKNDGMVITRSKTEFVKEFLIDSELTKSKPFTDFRIRIKRVTGVNIAIRDESQAQTQSYMQGIFAYSNDILNYANTAVAGISFQSNDFDAFPKRAYLARGIRVQVPTNYITREESGGSQAKYTRNVTTGADTGSEVRWDGKFRGDIADTSWRTNQGHVNYKKVYTNNPAWVYYDIMVNNRYGLGEFLEAQNINKYELYRIARYCDELVPDGKGGTEPRFTCNLYLQSRTEAFKVINDLASVFRSIVKWTNGEISASQDAPKAPIYTFSNSNVLDGQFGYESTSKRLRINQVGVTWNNPEDFYKQDVVTVEDSESILEEGKIIKKDTIAVGCTSEGQATRLGKWMLLTERLETELVKFRTGINGAYLRPGDVFYVQDYNRTNAIASGRLAQSNNHTTTTVYFDRTVPFEADTYQLHLAFPTGSAYLQQEQATINGTTYYRGDQITQAYVGGVLTNIDSTEDAADALDAASGNFVQLSWSEYISVESREFVSGSNQNLDSITVSSAFTSVPNSEVMFTLTNITDSNTAKGAVAYRTLNITENEDKTIDISGHLYLADKFAAVDRGYLLQPREFTPLPTFDNIRVPAPQNPSLSINRLSDTQDSTDVQLYSYVAEVSWGHPVVEGTDENYQYVDYYEIKHPYTPDRTYETAKATKATEFTFTSFVDPGQAYVLVRTVNIQGRRSAWSVVERAGTSDLTGSALNTISFLNLRAGGNIDTTVSVDSSNGTVSFGDEDFSLIGPQGNNYSITGATDLVEGSPAVANGEYFYIAFDASATSLKLLNIDIDTTAEDPATGSSPALNFEYWRESGQGDFTSVGTISQNIDILDLSDGSPGKALFINKFTTTADYSSSFSFGDTIRIGSGTSSWYGTVLEATATDITTVQYINKAFSSGAQIYSKDFKEDVALDFIIGRVLNSVGVYQLQLFAASKGSKGDTPETVSLSADKLVTKYDGDGLLLQASPDNNITLTATAGGGLGIEGISPSYRFLDNTGSPVQDWSQVNTYTIPEIDLPAEGSNIQYTVEATDEASPPYASEASDFVTIFTVSEGKDAETVNLVASSYVAKYDGTGSLIEASPDNNITITATPSAGLSSPTQYRFLDNTGSPVQDWSTDNDYIIPEVDLPQVNSTITYTVEATDGTSPYSSEASDNVTISALSDGLDGSPGTDECCGTIRFSKWVYSYLCYFLGRY